MTDQTQITLLLKLAGDGDSQAAADLLPLVYEELRAVAASRMRKVAPGQTLQPTALVHEAYLRVVGDAGSEFENGDHFFFVAARAMRDILVEQARRKSRLKHGGGKRRVSPDHLDLVPAAERLLCAKSGHSDACLMMREEPFLQCSIQGYFFKRTNNLSIFVANVA